MHIDPKIQQDGIRWFLGAGLAAILLALFLVSADNLLTHSKREILLKNTLYELRTAQAGIPSDVSDPRELGLFARAGHNASADEVSNEIEAPAGH